MPATGGTASCHSRINEVRENSGTLTQTNRRLTPEPALHRLMEKVSTAFLVQRGTWKLAGAAPLIQRSSMLA